MEILASGVLVPTHRIQENIWRIGRNDSTKYQWEDALELQNQCDG